MGTNLVMLKNAENTLETWSYGGKVGTILETLKTFQNGIFLGPWICGKLTIQNDPVTPYFTRNGLYLIPLIVCN